MRLVFRENSTHPLLLSPAVRAEFVNTNYSVLESGGSVDVSIVLRGLHSIPLEVTVECVEDDPVSAEGVCVCVGGGGSVCVCVCVCTCVRMGKVTLYCMSICMHMHSYSWHPYHPTQRDLMHCPNSSISSPTDDKDFVSITSIITFPTNLVDTSTMSAPISITIRPDDILEGTERLICRIIDPSHPRIMLGPPATVHIMDDDSESLEQWMGRVGSHC